MVLGHLQFYAGESYKLGEEINFTVYVANNQKWYVVQPFSIVSTVQKDGIVLASIGGGQIDYAGQPSAFSPHSKILYITNLTWNQKTSDKSPVKVQPGNYSFIVSFAGSVDYGGSGNCTFSIEN